jgi:hypothetical protein
MELGLLRLQQQLVDIGSLSNNSGNATHSSQIP